MNTPLKPTPMDRRTVIKWMLTAAASTALADRQAFSAGAAPAAPISATGYGTDPDLAKDYKPGDLWPLTLTEAQLRTATALCDAILPADGDSPAASTLGVPAFIDEWISAPYPGHDRDREMILAGIAWLDAESHRRYQGDFAGLAERPRTALLDDICHEPEAEPGFQTAAKFFARYRDLTAGGYFTTPVGMKDLGYVGNMPLVTFDGPPPAVLQKLGLA